MKNTKKRIIHYILFLNIIPVILLFAGCATADTKASKNDGGITAAAPDLQSLPEINSVKAYSVPPENLPGIPYSVKLSESAVPSGLKKIYVASTKSFKWKPEELLTDVYVYDKAAEKYVACVKNCYQQGVWQGQWGNLGTVWIVWAKDDAAYLINPSAYMLFTKDGMELLGGYIAETGLKNVKIALGPLGWQPDGETADFYLYSIKEKKFVAYIKDCWRNSYGRGIWGWNKTVKNAYQLISTNGTQFLIEESDYVICNEEGYEYINGWLAKTDYDNLMLSCGKLGWQPQGETQDYYLYSKKQKKIVTCIKDCWKQGFGAGAGGWGGNVKNAYSLITTDGKQYLAETSDYIIQEKIDDVLIDAYSPDIKVTVSADKLEAGKKITISATGVKNKYLLVYGTSKDKNNYSLLKILEGGESRKVSLIVPFSSDKILIAFSNQKNRWAGTCYESNLINKPVKNGRIFQIPSSYEKANMCRKSKPDQRIRELANDSELENLRLSDQDAYLDEIIKRINKMDFDNYGKVTAIHDFIAYLVCYDYDNVYEWVEIGKNAAGNPIYEDRLRKDSKVKTDYKGVLEAKKTSCSGYSALFYEMCSRADIVCEIVSGYARGYLWKPDDDVNKTNHAWNVVMLDGAWYLIDNTWDAGSERDGVRKVSCDHTWLFAPPEEFYPKHLPLNPELQLLKKPVTAAEFRNTKPTYPKL